MTFDCDRPQITAVVPTGSGALVFHRQLADLLRGYDVLDYPPAWERTPWNLTRLRARAGRIVHMSPDHAAFATPSGSALVATFLNYVLDAGMRAHSSLAQRMHYLTDLRLFTRLGLRRATVVTAVSHATAQIVRDDLNYSGTIHVIPNSVDSGRFHPADESRPSRHRRVLFCATPSRRKGFHWLDAIAEGVSDLAELACATGSRVSLEGTGGRLVLLGAIQPENLPKLYRSADVFVLPSIREGMSLAQLEAMASGLPVVAWRVPSSIELLGDIQSEFLADLGDVDGFIERVRWLLCNPERSRQIGARNRALMVSSHQPATMAEAYSKIFSEVS